MAMIVSAVIPTLKRMGRRETRHASVVSMREGVSSKKTASKGLVFLRIVTSLLDFISRLWVPVSTVSMADAGRMHLGRVARVAKAAWAAQRFRSVGSNPRGRVTAYAV